MKIKKLASNGHTTYALVMDTGEEAVSHLLDFAREHDVEAGGFTGLGAFSSCVLGFFDLDRKDYERIAIDEQVEVVSLVGDFATHRGEIKVHPHVVVAGRDGRAMGGHLLEAHVRPTLEVLVTDTEGRMRRKTDEATGLPLLDLD